ncbi:MAG: beta-lactamase family protein [Acidobacteria bacterium]|nr:beta-lactamase family protein [Acidobacteriota bacterium]MCB9399662.1 beta-lactamase family protein [Acidobacteriota bacterium]
MKIKLPIPIVWTLRLFLFALGSFGIGFGQNREMVLPEIDALIQPLIEKGAPGCVVGVIQDKAFIHQKAYGLANLDYDIPLNPNSVFRIASTSKQFTAACIFLLEIQGKLNLNDDIHLYLKDFPHYDQPIRIHNLIYHTSGIRDYTGLFYLCGWEDDYPYSAQDLYFLICRQKALDFEPGSQFSYSNSGYYLLGKIVEVITGKSLNQYAQANIFGPLGMGQTHFHDNHRMVVKNRAYGYSRQGEHFQIAMSQNDVVGDGGIFTNLDDLLRWDTNFCAPKIGGPNWLARMETPGKLRDGAQVPYAGGLFIRQYRGLKKINHTGWYAGFKSSMTRFPQAGVTIIILANNPDLAPPVLTNQIAEIVLKDRLAPRAVAKPKESEPPSDPKPPQPIPASLRKALVGRFFCPELNHTYELFEENGKLKCKISPTKITEVLVGEANTLHVDPEIRLTPNGATSGNVSGFSLAVGDSHNIQFQRNPEPQK